MLAMKVKLFEIQSERVMRAIQHEKTDGGVIDRTVSEEMDRLNHLMNDVKDFVTPDSDSVSIAVQGKNTVGIMERIFGGGSNAK